MTATIEDRPLFPPFRGHDPRAARWPHERSSSIGGGFRGLRRVLWQGRPAWMVSEYKDIHSALVDPRLSAEAIKPRLMPDDVDTMSVIFARIDDRERNRLRHMMTRGLILLQAGH
jgi:cytochrome P450